MAKRRAPCVVVRDDEPHLHILLGHEAPWLYRLDGYGSWSIFAPEFDWNRNVSASSRAAAKVILGDRYDDLKVGEYREAWLEIRT